MRWVAVGISGASGSCYGLRLVQELLHQGLRVELLVTSAGYAVLEQEAGLKPPEQPQQRRQWWQEQFSGFGQEQLQVPALDDFASPLASGSGGPQALVIAPCSMGTLGRLAAGLSHNLLERGADVMLKEGRPLVLVPRETPLSSIHLQNMLRLSRAGACILPAMPGFYRRPQSVADIEAFVVAKIIQQLGLDQNLLLPWGEDKNDE